jgi:predicted transcriptional regulator
MVRKNPNITNYHYRADIHDPNDNRLLVSKYYFTLQDLCKEYRVSTFTIYKIIKDPNYKTKSANLKGIKFYKDYKPAIITTSIPNEEIFGELDDI